MAKNGNMPPVMRVMPPGAAGRAKQLAENLERQRGGGGRIPLPAGEPVDRAPYDPMTGPAGMGKDPGAVHLPGGQALLNVKPQILLPVDHMFRVEPEVAWFGPVRPTRPISVPLGAFEVPHNMQFWFNDYEFRVLRLSGLDPGDWVYAEDGRFSNVMGFDVTISGKRMANLYYEIQPHATPLTRAPFRQRSTSFPIPPRLPADTFNITSSNSAGLSAGPGTSLLPVTTRVQGPRNQPFCFVVRQGEYVELSAVIFNRIPSPIAGIEARVAGFTLQTTISEAVIRREMLR